MDFMPMAKEHDGELKPRRSNRRIDIDPELVLNALSTAVLVVDAETRLHYMNNAAEQLFRGSARSLYGQKLNSLVPGDSPLFSVIRQALIDDASVADYQVTLCSPRIGQHVVNVQAEPLAELTSMVVVSMQERSVAAKIDRQLTHRGVARSVGAMAAMLAHEVKNPLAGIRGAAQLLEDSVRPDDRPLTRLIRDEADRVCGLVDRIDMFAAGASLQRAAVNIHEVLSRVRALAENSFGKHIRFNEHYDPSLPPVYGNYDQLVQVFLNLIKNAAEASPKEGGEVTVTTAYWHGVRFAVTGSNRRMHLPLMVSIQDNGQGVPDDLKAHLFEPFVSSKPNGSGLGLALVAKIIDDHGGVIEFESEPRRTIFRVMLPMYPPTEALR